jgi:hypothetical protein
LRVLNSYSKNKKYVFLQYKIDFGDEQYNKEEVNKVRQYFLEIACGATKLKFPELKKIVGIGMAPIKFYPKTTKDILLMDCSYWNNEMEEYYSKENELEGNRFYLTGNVEGYEFHIKEFPDSRLKY